LIAKNKETYNNYRETYKNYINFVLQEDTSKPFESDSLSMIKSLAIGMQEFFENYFEEIEITTNRNIIDYEFTPKISRIERKEVKEILKKKIQEIENDIFKTKGQFIEISSRDKMLPNKNSEILKSAGVFRDWPDDRLMYRNNRDTFFCLINEGDHLTMASKIKNSSQITNDILGYFDFMETLEKKIIFVYDKYFGYLNSLCSNVGNGTYFRIKLRIKNDQSSINEIKKKLEEYMKDIKIDILKDNEKTFIELTNKNPFFGFSSILVEILGIKEHLEKVKN
jgi:hypothetical protein